VGDRASLRRAFQGAQVVYHAAAHISIVRNEWPLLERTNVQGTRNVVDAVQDCGVRRLIHFSSIHALEQGPLDQPLDESRSLVISPHAALYDRTKAMGEAEVRRAVEQGLDATILYPTAIIGPYDWRPSHMGDVLLALCRRRLPALVRGGFDWVDVRDVVAGALQAENLAPAGARYLLSGQWVSIQGLARQIEQLAGVRAPRVIAPLALARLGAPLATWYGRCCGRRPLFTPDALQALDSNHTISHERATRELGYQPRPFRETLRDTLAWFAQEGYLPPTVQLRRNDD
jgi:dihydroflavonol-4-reductase